MKSIGDRPGAASGGRIPLIIGVTGHRDLVEAELPALCASVRAFFERMRTDYPHTPVRLYSGLAAGADQLAADVAAEFGIPVVPTLPMPESLYRDDFASDPNARAAFDRHLTAAGAERVEIPLLEGTSADDIASDAARSGAKTGAQYAMLSNFLSVRCHVLLALWDGRASDDPGGTAWTVGCMRSGVDASRNRHLESGHEGLVYVVPAGRRGGPAVGALESGFASSRELDAAMTSIAQIEDYNGHVFEEAGTAGAGSEIATAYAKADALALRYQTRLAAARGRVTACVSVMMLSYAIYGEFDRTFPVIVCYNLALVAGAAVWVRQRSEKIEERYLDYRAFAEALRVQKMWVESGLVASAASNYLHKHQHHHEWIHFALQAFLIDRDLVALVVGRRAAAPAMHRHIVSGDAWREWLDGQRSYFAQASQKRRRIVERSNKTSSILYLAGLVAAIATLLGQPFPVPDLLDHLLVFGMGVFPATAAIVAANLDQAGVEEEGNQMVRMAELFEVGGRQIDAMTDSSGGADRLLGDVIVELGAEALQENGDWLALHRGRLLEIPLAPG